VTARLAVLAALAALRPSDQEALRLIEWEQLDVAAAAQVMGCSAATFRVRLHRARRRFARALGQADEPGGGDPDGSDPGGRDQDAASRPARSEIRA